MTRLGKYGLRKGKGVEGNSHFLVSHSFEREAKMEDRPLPSWFWPAIGGGGLLIILLVFIYMLARLFTPTHLPSTGTQVSNASALIPNNLQTQSTTVLKPIKTSVPTIAGSQPNTIIDSKGVTMAFIPGGSFQMGSNKNGGDDAPIHTVTLDAFYMDIYMVTNSRYKECVDTQACQSPSRPDSHTRYPYYDDAQYEDFPVL